MEFTCLLLNKPDPVKTLVLLALQKNHILAGDLVTWLEEVRPELLQGWKTEFDREFGRRSRRKK